MTAVDAEAEDLAAADEAAIAVDAVAATEAVVAADTATVAVEAAEIEITAAIGLSAAIEAIEIRRPEPNRTTPDPEKIAEEKYLRRSPSETVGMKKK